MTIQKCLHICKTKGYEFSGLQWQIECYCGNMPTNGFEWAWPGKCDDRCAGDSNQMCGGSMAMNVYKTLSKNPKGLCVYDNPTERVFDGPSIAGHNNMTIDSCKHFCSNYKFFGVQRGDECYCGNHDFNFLPSPSLECNKPCDGNKNQFCGGLWRMNVYLNENDQRPEGLPISDQSDDKNHTTTHTSVHIGTTKIKTTAMSNVQGQEFT